MAVEERQAAIVNTQEVRKKILEYGLSFPGTFEDTPFRDDNWQLVRLKSNKKAFLWIYERDGFININVKAEPQKAIFWREAYNSVIPGYHQNKEHWNTLILDGSIPRKDVKTMIAESYDLIAENFADKVYEAVRKIPKGFVATYGQVAQMTGDKRKARAVGNALHKNPDSGVIPCHRVVNSKGELSGAFAFGGADEQANRLMSEGVEVRDGVVDLTIYKWNDSGK